MSTIQFEGTLDDSVAQVLHWMGRSPTLRAQRRRAAAITGISCAAATVGTVFMRGRISPLQAPASVWVLTITIAAALGVAAAYAYRLVDRYSTRNRCRKLLAEHHGGKTRFAVTIALLPEGLTVTEDGVQTTLSWAVATGVADTADGIELSFVAGAVVAPNRAFKDSAERTSFLMQARAFLLLSQ